MEILLAQHQEIMNVKIEYIASFSRFVGLCLHYHLRFADFSEPASIPSVRVRTRTSRCDNVNLDLAIHLFHFKNCVLSKSPLQDFGGDAPMPISSDSSLYFLKHVDFDLQLTDTVPDYQFAAVEADR